MTRYLADGVQHAIVKKCHNNDINKWGSVSDMKTALEYVNPKIVNYIRVGEPNSALSPYNQNLFKSKVQEGRYMVAGFCRKNSTIGHVVVITNYNSATGKYTLYDPWNGKTPKITGDDIFAYQNGLAGNDEDTYGLEYFFYIA